MKRHGKLPKNLQKLYDKQDYFLPPDYEMVDSTPKLQYFNNIDGVRFYNPNELKADGYLIGLHHIKETKFNNMMFDLLEKVKNLMLTKGNQYNENPTDRFDQFKKASKLTKISPVRTLYGMLVKHIISLSDMISSEKQYSKELWNEKIIDNINYLLLLAGAIKEFNLIKE